MECPDRPFPLPSRHPQAADYVQMADFHLFVLRLSEARFIGGFGDMGTRFGREAHLGVGLRRPAIAGEAGEEHLAGLDVGEGLDVGAGEDAGAEQAAFDDGIDAAIEIDENTFGNGGSRCICFQASE